jgi:predicted SprT family Zn-dependent metalloprotease
MLKEIVRTEVVKYINIAREAYPNFNIPIPPVTFSNRMTTTGGKCGRTDHYSPYGDTSTYELKFSIPIMEDNSIPAFCSQVVAHEVAHMVAHIVYKTWGHDKAFYHVLGKTFGKSGNECSRTHTLNVNRNNRKRYLYVCSGCSKTMLFTSIRHNKCLRGAVYRHNCGGRMKLVGS